MKKQNHKQIIGSEPDVIAKEEVKPNDKKRLLCTRDSDMPGIGYFKSGSIIEDADTISKIGTNPNFETLTQEETL